MVQAGTPLEQGGPDGAAAEAPSKQPMLDCSVPHERVAAFLWAVLTRIVPKVGVLASSAPCGVSDASPTWSRLHRLSQWHRLYHAEWAGVHLAAEDVRVQHDALPLRSRPPALAPQRPGDSRLRSAAGQCLALHRGVQHAAATPGCNATAVWDVRHCTAGPTSSSACCTGSTWMVRFNPTATCCAGAFGGPEGEQGSARTPGGLCAAETLRAHAPAAAGAWCAHQRHPCLLRYPTRVWSQHCTLIAHLICTKGTARHRYCCAECPARPCMHCGAEQHMPVGSSMAVATRLAARHASGNIWTISGSLPLAPVTAVGTRHASARRIGPFSTPHQYRVGCVSLARP